MGAGWLTARISSCPYSLTTNDSKFGRGVFGSGEDFFAFLRDSFDLLYEEGAECPRMMSVGLHMRLTGHPGRAKALIRFIQYILGHPQVWICRREDIARHWIAALSRAGVTPARRRHKTEPRRLNSPLAWSVRVGEYRPMKACFGPLTVLAVEATAGLVPRASGAGIESIDTIVVI